METRPENLWNMPDWDKREASSFGPHEKEDTPLTHLICMSRELSFERYNPQHPCRPPKSQSISLSVSRLALALPLVFPAFLFSVWLLQLSSTLRHGSILSRSLAGWADLPPDPSRHSCCISTLSHSAGPGPLMRRGDGTGAKKRQQH